jgi:hypothetical protein
MTKHTTRDAIWNAVLEEIEETDQSAGKWRRRFDAEDVEERLEADTSRRTIRDTLATIAELGHVESARRQGEYRVPEGQQHSGSIEAPDIGEIDIGNHPLDGKKIVLIGCGDSKLRDKAPARDLYDSNYFDLKKQYAELHADLWYILSAEHGVVAPNEVIDSYDTHLSDVDQKEWEDRVMDELPNFGGSHVEVLAGEDYISVLEVLLDLWAEEVQYPTRGMKIGQRMQWLKEQTEDAVPV